MDRKNAKWSMNMEEGTFRDKLLGRRLKTNWRSWQDNMCVGLKGLIPGNDNIESNNNSFADNNASGDDTN